jgi:putative hydrolase of the HAD superfamily
MNLPKVIFLDAVGTLFGVQGSVGLVYQEIAQQFEVDADADALDQAFFQSFRAATPLAFPGEDVTQIPGREYAWWKAIAIQTFKKVGAFQQFSDFDDFFDALYVHFATEKPWFIYQDIQTALEHWRNEGIEMGIISNFDSRIYFVLQALGLFDFFSSITISTEVGAAKPNPKIFLAALAKHNCLPDDAWHVGDSFTEDYEGSRAVGIRGIWLKRREG